MNEILELKKICNRMKFLASVIMGLDLRGKFCTILKFYCCWTSFFQALNNYSVCEIFECELL